MDHQDPGTWSNQDSMEGEQVLNVFSLNAGVSQKMGDPKIQYGILPRNLQQDPLNGPLNLSI